MCPNKSGVKYEFKFRTDVVLLTTKTTSLILYIHKTVNTNTVTYYQIKLNVRVSNIQRHMYLTKKQTIRPKCTTNTQ